MTLSYSKAPQIVLQDAIYDRLTDATVGLTVTASKYVAVNGGVQKYHGDFDLTPEGMVAHLRPGVSNAPIVLISIGDIDAQASNTVGNVVMARIAVEIYLFGKSARSQHESVAGDVAGATRSPGLWQVASDVADRLLNIGLVADTDGSWCDSLRFESLTDLGRVDDEKSGNNGVYAMRLDFAQEVGDLYGLVAWSDLTTLTGVDLTLTKEVSTEGLEYEIDVTIDIEET
jgi:hypothetical protein